MVLHRVLVPFKHLGTTQFDLSLTPTLPMMNHNKTLQSNSISAGFLLLVD